MESTRRRERHIGLWGATGIGVGAIVGGGILALSGTAFALTGPGALVAFGLNGVLALMTALSLAELATAFPQSGGGYVFAKRLLAVGPAFAVGWVIWFASIVAAALYAIGFATFCLEGLRSLLSSLAPLWLGDPRLQAALAVWTTVAAAVFVSRSPGGSGNVINVVKVAVFAVLIGGGVWVWIREAPGMEERFWPFFPAGSSGLLQAMGTTFIALQGFDLIAAVAGEVREPRRVLPRAMLMSLGIALLVYLPFLAVDLAVGTDPEVDFTAFARAHPDTVVALASGHYLGPAGYWLVVVAGVLSMLSALLANLFASARVAQAMARDRTLPTSLERTHPRHGTPVLAICITALIASIILLVVGDVGAAGAASSLIFLLSFTLAHLLCLVTRRRKPHHLGFRVPFWPWLPAAGALCCLALAVYQAWAVPVAGVVALAWLLLGLAAYVRLFARRARVLDAASEAADPDLLELRGRSPLALVPVANPENAPVLALVASTVTPPRVGRVLLLHVVRPGSNGEDLERTLGGASVLQESLAPVIRAGVRCEALVTVATDPWEEIRRVARVHACASVLMGLSDLTEPRVRSRLEELASSLSCNLAFLRAAPDWHPAGLRRIIVPISGRGTHHALRARLLTGLMRRAEKSCTVDYLLCVPHSTDSRTCRELEGRFAALVRDEAPGSGSLTVVPTRNVVDTILDAAVEADLLVVGLGQEGRHERRLGTVAGEVAGRAPCATLLISARD